MQNGNDTYTIFLKDEQISKDRMSMRLRRLLNRSNSENSKEYFELLNKEALENTWSKKSNSIVEVLRKYE